MRHPRVALLADELRIVQHARQQGSVVYVMGCAHARLSAVASPLQLPRRYLLELPFKARANAGAEVYWDASKGSLASRSSASARGMAVMHGILTRVCISSNSSQFS